MLWLNLRRVEKRLVRPKSTVCSLSKVYLGLGESVSWLAVGGEQVLEYSLVDLARGGVVDEFEGLEEHLLVVGAAQLVAEEVDEGVEVHGSVDFGQHVLALGGVDVAAKLAEAFAQLLVVDAAVLVLVQKAEGFFELFDLLFFELCFAHFWSWFLLPEMKIEIYKKKK